MKLHYLMTYLLLGGLAAQAEPQFVTLPLPQGQSMEFALVRVSDSPNLFSSVEFKMGDRLDSGVDRRQTSTSVSGTVFVPGKDGAAGYWAIPVGRTEVTRAQYAAVMGTPIPKEGAKLPVTGISRLQAYTFIEKLNTWLGSKENKAALAKISSPNRHGKPFVRLPLENEWEFAARGGTEVEPHLFESGVPYGEGELKKAEVFFSGRPLQSPKEVGSTGVCNPCGLYDMLGNVSEMVQDTFRPEYHFGRAGSYVNCGASYIAEEKDVTAYCRGEAPVCKADGTPWTNSRVGFRLVIGSSIIAGKVAGQTLEDEWKEYLASSARLVLRPGVSTTDDTTSRLQREKADLSAQLASLSQQLKTASSTDKTEVEKLRQSIADMKSKIDDMQAIVNESYVYVAEAGVDMLSTSCSFATEDAVGEWQNRLMLDDEECVGEIRERIIMGADARKANIEGYWRTYIKGCRSLCCVEDSIREKSMAEKRKLIAEKNPPQLAIFDKSIEFFNLYRKQGNFTESDFNRWKAELLKIGQDLVGSAPEM